jgi:hypothetical protein
MTIDKYDTILFIILLVILIASIILKLLCLNVFKCKPQYKSILL